jgi:hypothetical protein
VPYFVRILAMLVVAGILLQDPVTFEVGWGPWYDQFVGLGRMPMGHPYARAPTAADIVGFLIDSAFMTGKASIEAFNVACCWEGVKRYQELARFLRNKLIREKYGLVTADVAFAVAHVPPPYYSPFHIHLTNLAYTHLKELLFLAVENNPLHPGICIRLYDLTTGQPSPYLHQFTRADVIRVRELYRDRNGSWSRPWSPALRALSATGQFRILVAAAGRISGVDLLDGLRYEASHALSVPSCACLGDVFCGYWHSVGYFGGTLMIGTQVQYCSFDGTEVLLDKSEDFCDADAIAAARVARDAALTDLTDADRAKIASDDAAWAAWPGPIPECRPATEGTVAARLKAAGFSSPAPTLAEIRAAAPAPAPPMSLAEMRAAYQREQAAAPRPVVPPAPASPVAEEDDGPTLDGILAAQARRGAEKRKAEAKKAAKKKAKARAYAYRYAAYSR